MTKACQYELPDGQLSLSGPVARPESGSLPLRGDMAHIALARHYLVPHYVQPHKRVIGPEGARLRRSPAPGGEVVTDLKPGTDFEALDYAGDWCWGCLGPEGPTGYVPLTSLVAD